MFLRALLFAAVACSAACSSAPLRSATGTDAGPGADAAAAPSNTQTITVLDAARITSDPAASNFQTVTAQIDLSSGPYQHATLIADLGSTCFPFSSWANDPPPVSQNYPADCDAFDRNFELSLDDPDADADADAPPGLELVRAITPFGGPMHLEHDLTALANALPGAHRLRARINTYADASGMVSGSNGGWTLTLTLALASGTPAQHPLAVIPLFYGDLTSTTKRASATFTTPAGTRSAYLEYRTTGHGQAAGDIFECNGPAEEFCRRQHTVQLDGAALQAFTPWRTCTDACTLVTAGDAGLAYCAENPCGDVSSVKAPRANWCPGSDSPPIVLDAPELATAGSHDLSWQISSIAAGGLVRVSITYYAFAD